MTAQIPPPEIGRTPDSEGSTARQAIHITGLNYAGNIIPDSLRKTATPLLFGIGAQQ
jgi:hypothetical protein